MRGNYLHLLLPPFWSGAGLYPGFIHFLSASIFPVWPDTTSSCNGTASADGICGGGPPAQNPSVDQQPTGCAGSGLGQCRHWGNLPLWYLGPGSVSGNHPSPAGSPGWRVGGMRWWPGSVFCWSIRVFTKIKVMGTRLYDVNKGNIIKVERGRRLMGYFCVTQNGGLRWFWLFIPNNLYFLR